MNSITNAFADKAFIPFITGGDPDLATTRQLILALQEAGADLIEVGFPFSDPTAEGPTIQAANIRALKGGVTTDALFDLLEEMRNAGELRVPLCIMTYANVVFSYGIERFGRRAHEVGVKGLILPDVPFEESDEFALPLRAAGIVLISLVAPTSQERVAKIAQQAEGFLYCVSSLGVTGARTELDSGAEALVQRAHAANPALPCAVGFGIATPQQAADVARFADGVIIGSAIVSLIAEHGSDAPAAVGKFSRSIKAALREVSK